MSVIRLIIVQIIITLLLFQPVIADENFHIPQVSKKAIDSYQYDFAYAGYHRAFAIASGGAWAWKADVVTEEEASRAALSACSSYTQQKCQLYSLNDRVVFDQKAWFESWGPYKTRQQAEQSEIGTLLGQRFYDLQFTDPKGAVKSISDLRGKVVFVHFWGCWCPSCRHEFGTLTDMYRILQSKYKAEVELVVLQVRESIETSRAWTEKNGLTTLPLSDSGVMSEEDTQLTLKGGAKIKDRKLARVFPASYVLDKNGIVVFSHMGSIKDWTEYIPFYSDVIKRSH